MVKLLRQAYSFDMIKNKFKLTNNKIIFTAIAISLLIFGTTLAFYINKQSDRRKAVEQFPQDYPYTCPPPPLTNFDSEEGGRYVEGQGCSYIEDKGKVIVANRPEVKQLVSQYGRKGVIIKALEFSEVKDKTFLKSLLGENYVELGCIIYVSYPGGQLVYLEDDKLDVIKRLDGQLFAQWLKTASQQDIDRFNKNLR